MNVLVTWKEFNYSTERFEAVDTAIYEARETSRMLIVQVNDTYAQKLHKYKRRGRSTYQKNNMQRVRWGLRPGKYIEFQWSPCEYAVY